MADFGFSPPTRVFEVAGAGACLLCDDWPGIDECFEPGKAIIVIRSAEGVVSTLDRHNLNNAGASSAHPTYIQRAQQAERAFLDCLERRRLADNISVPKDFVLEERT